MKSTGEIEVLLVDSNAGARHRKEGALCCAPDLRVRTAQSSEQALAACRESRVEVVLFDPAQLPEGGVTFLRALRALCPSVRLIALVERLEAEQARTLVAAGVVGYLRKEIDTFSLIDAIHAVRRGERALSPEVLALLLTQCLAECPFSCTSTVQPYFSAQQVAVW